VQAVWGVAFPVAVRQRQVVGVGRCCGVRVSCCLRGAAFGRPWGGVGVAWGFVAVPSWWHAREWGAGVAGSGLQVVAVVCVGVRRSSPAELSARHTTVLPATSSPTVLV